MTEAAQHSTSQHSSTSNGVIDVYGPVEILTTELPNLEDVGEPPPAWSWTCDMSALPS